jgi:hypothetical protein
MKGGRSFGHAIILHSTARFSKSQHKFSVGEKGVQQKPFESLQPAEP